MHIQLYFFFLKSLVCECLYQGREAFDLQQFVMKPVTGMVMGKIRSYLSQIEIFQYKL